MFKTIFGKQLAAFISTLLVSFVILGVALSSFFTNYLINQKISVLEKQGNKFARKMYEKYWSELSSFVPAPAIDAQIKYMFEIMQDYLDISLIITDANFYTLMLSSNIESSRGQVINIKELDSVKEGQTPHTQGNMNGLIEGDVLTVACPIMNNGTFIGAVFISTPMVELRQNMQEVAWLVITYMIVAAAFSGVLIYFTSKSISKPIFKINEAAKVIANGNFDKRLDVETKDEVGQLAESFNYMAESLHKQEKHRREFIANISHDLRSPLTSMKGFLQAILDGTIPEEKFGYYLSIILEETERLTKLANDILDISKIESFQTELNRTYFDLNELIRKTVIVFESRVTSKQIDLNILFADEKTTVYADEEKIKRVLNNLIDNAIKFTEDEGQISIETSIKDDSVSISVKDSGKGISIEDQKRIFERFYKVDTSRGEDKKGSGLGLSIVKEFIKAHGEDILLRSELNKGSEFIFQLPLKEPKKE